MQHQSQKPLRILAVDPGLCYLAVAIFENGELIWYRVRSLARTKKERSVESAVRQFLTGVAQTFDPQVLAVEEPFYREAMENEELLKVTEAIKTWGKWRGLRVFGYFPPEVKAFFCRDEQTKPSLAMAMIERYPFLERYLTSLPWRRRYWFHVFDAVSVGLMCHMKLAQAAS